MRIGISDGRARSLCALDERGLGRAASGRKRIDVHLPKSEKVEGGWPMIGEIPAVINPMDVEIEGSGRYRHADTVADLAAILLSSTRTKSSPSFHRALIASLEALEF